MGDKAPKTVDLTNFILSQLKMGYQQAREQARAWFWFSLIAAGIGFGLIAVGVIFGAVDQIAAGLILDAAATLFFAQSKAANKRVDKIQANLMKTYEVLSAIGVANTIEDSKSRDKLKAEIVRKAPQR